MQYYIQQVILILHIYKYIIIIIIIIFIVDQEMFGTFLSPGEYDGASILTLVGLCVVLFGVLPTHSSTYLPTYINHPPSYPHIQPPTYMPHLPMNLLTNTPTQRIRCK
jgi:hypothetical protein